MKIDYADFTVEGKSSYSTVGRQADIQVEVHLVRSRYSKGYILATHATKAGRGSALTAVQVRQAEDLKEDLLLQVLEKLEGLGWTQTEDTVRTPYGPPFTRTLLIPPK